MGICNSSNDNNNNSVKKDLLNNNKKNLTIENDTTGIFLKYNYTDTSISAIKLKNNGYLLPSQLGKRDDINK